MIAGVGGLLLKRLRGFGGGEVSEAVWLEDGRLAVGPSVTRGVLSIVIVGMGASLGREAAAQLTGAAAASRLCEKFGLPQWQRRLLVPCGAGAGMAAVTTCRWVAPCSLSRCCSSPWPCRSCCRRWRQA